VHFHLSFVLRCLLPQNCADERARISAPIRTGNTDLRYLCVTVFVMVCCDFVRRACVVASRRCDDNRAPHSFVKCPRG